MAMRPWRPILSHPLAVSNNACHPVCFPSAVASPLCYTIAYSAAADAAIAWRRFMPRHLCGRHRMTQDQHVWGACPALGLLLSVLGLLACLAGCTGPNPLERARPPDAVAWDEARLADSPYFYQRFLTQYPTSAFARQAGARLEALEWAAVQPVDGIADYDRF